MNLTEEQIREHSFSIAADINRQYSYKFCMLSLEEGVVAGAMWLQESQTQWVDINIGDPKPRTTILISDGKNEYIGYFSQGYYYSKDGLDISGAQYWMPIPDLPPNNSGTALSA